MTASDWGGSWYGSHYNLNAAQLNEYSVAVAQGLEGGGKSKSNSASTPKPKPKPRGYAALTIAQLRAKAAERGIKIPSKCKTKCMIIEHLRK